MNRVSERLYTAAQVRQLDALAINEHGIAGFTLMCRAGAAVVSAALEHFPAADRWLVLCGAGNNGGDGYVVGHLAREKGIDVQLVALKSPEALQGDALTAAREYEAAGGIISKVADLESEAPDLVIDALLGTGIDREVDGAYKTIIEQVNGLQCHRVAVDLPSGLNADTGQVMGVAIRADLTVSFIGQKRGLFTLDGPDHSGVRVFDDLDTPQEIHQQVGQCGSLLSRPEINKHLGPRRLNTHKGSFGHVLVVGGLQGMSGAVRLAGEAALRTGAGLVSLATHSAHADIINATRPELMVNAVTNAEELKTALEKASVVAVGPGLGTGEWSRDLLAACMEQRLPLVVDADGLNLLAQNPHQRDHWVLTPHPAEAARLLGVTTAQIQSDRISAALELAERYGAAVVLKGSGSVVTAPGGEWAICPYGNPGMATAGSGDVLTGVVAAMLAQGLNPFEAARAGALVHAVAGDKASAAGQRGMIATDIISSLRGVVNE